MPKIVDHPARRREISAIAATLIAEGGMEVATIREIAHRSGYSKGVIEHYFNGKAELISGALDWVNQGYASRAAQATFGLSGLAALRKRIEAILPLNRAVTNEWKVRLVFWSTAAIETELRTQQAERFENAVEFYASDIRVAIEQGDIAAGSAAKPLAHRLFASTIGLSTTALYSPSLSSKLYFRDEIDHLIHRLILGL
ncbi:MAG: TetR/AcrR family transcriptional regulator [Halioglobus sp.]